MSRKMIAATSILIAVFATAVPVYAQTVTTPVSPVNQGFFGAVESFFGGLFHHQDEIMQGPKQGFQSQNITLGQPMPNPSGMPDYQSMQQRRLSFLVQQGKITQAQADAILTELMNVQTELKNWADSQGINESYVLGGPMGNVMEQERQQGNFNSTSQSQGATQQLKTHRFMQGQGGDQGFHQGAPGSAQGEGPGSQQDGPGSINQQGQ